MIGNKKTLNVLLFIFLLMTVLPNIHLMGFNMPIVYLFTPMVIMIYPFDIYGRINGPSVAKKILVIWIAILSQIFISSLISTANKLGHFVFPTDIAQYFIRAVFLIFLIIYTFKEKINKEKFIKYFLVILIIGMSIGILQWIPWPGREFFIRLYPFRDGSLQLSQLNRPLYQIRVHGFAQHATANGGIACFAFIFGYSVKKYYFKYKKMSLLLLMLATVNIIASQGRAGMLALVFSIFLLYLVNIKLEKNGLQTTLYLVGLISVLSLLLIFLYYIENPFALIMFQRWNTLFESGGGARATTQPQYFFSLMQGIDYLIGIAKPMVNRSAITFGVEVEPVNIFVTYGLLGFILQYALVGFLFRYFYMNISEKVEDKALLTLLVASFVSLFGYQIFSIGHYFFREIRVGLFPWILMGVTIGLNERVKSASLSMDELNHSHEKENCL